MKKILYILGILILGYFFIKLIAIDNSKENSVEVSGVVKSMSEGGVKDLIFELEGKKHKYYINRGLENGFTLEKAKADYIGKKATIYYPKKWALFFPMGTMCKHINQISIDDKEIYSEWK